MEISQLMCKFTVKIWLLLQICTTRIGKDLWNAPHSELSPAQRPSVELDMSALETKNQVVAI